MGKFKVTQAYKGTAHDGLDLVGIDSKQIHSTVNGTVIHAGWENSSNHNQGFGKYVSIRRNGTNERYYFGHMSEIYVTAGQNVAITDVIGKEGSTGNSTGSHCHYCCRIDGTKTPLNINTISGIPNVEGGVYDDGASGGSSSTISKFQLSYLKNGTWKNFDDKVQSSMDGIKIQTPSNSTYYLQYRTWNQGKTDYYPYVKSNINDYAGASGKPVQRLQIQAYNNSGTKLTKDVVVMYRAYVEGKWLPWVSNADPEWMRSVQEKYDLGGTLDTNGSYAGEAGKNIEGIEIHVYEEENTVDFTGGELDATLSYMVDSSSNWTNFTHSTVANRMDGIKIQTPATKSYYLSYQTWNHGLSSFYPSVTSIQDDYAGSAGKAIEKLKIQVFKKDGTKLSSGVIVMYRVLVNNKWLPWVSNADPEWMRGVQNKYDLGGTLDTASGYAGIEGQSITGVEIRIFEDNSFNAGTDSFLGSEVNLSSQYLVDSTWNNFNNSVTASHIDGVKFQTAADESFYISYQTFNSGQAAFYPAVTSKENDYAGYPGKPIQLLRVQAYNNDGTKLTSGVVIMYRTLVNGRWLPWVSNADAYSMQSVQNQFNLGGTLDSKSSYAGIDGQNISGIEIRAFKGESNSNPIENLPGEEAAPTLSYMVNNNWTNFSNSVMANQIDGIKIQTAQDKPYFLRYQTWNSGQASYYPQVSSRVNDYAGSSGKPIQLLSINAYRDDGTKLTTGVVVMYRVYVEDRWLPWVSNADPDWMRSVQAKYNLDGTIDTNGYYAGISGKNIGGVEVRIFEENNVDIPPVTPTGKYKIIDAPFISQLGTYPTGCESVSTVMALKYAGVDISVDSFIDDYLPMTGVPFNPRISFGGDPRTTSGFGCYAPVIEKAVNNLLSGWAPHLFAYSMHEYSLEKICSHYIDNNIPVILWATMRMDPPRNGAVLQYQGESIQWIIPEHCLLLVGYDDEHYIFNDPQQTRPLTYYKKAAVETAYAGLHKQAIAICRRTEHDGYHRPAIPDNSDLIVTFSDLIAFIEILEDLYVDFHKQKWGALVYDHPLTSTQLVRCITNFLRNEAYKGYQWFFTTGHAIDYEFVSYVKANTRCPGLYESLQYYICESDSDRLSITDGERGILDLSHFAATLEGYLSLSVPPAFWAGWGGDLASGMSKTTEYYEKVGDASSPYYGKTLQQVSDMLIGADASISPCNYTDFCCDFDAYKIQEYMKKSTEYRNMHLLSESINWYYNVEKHHIRRYRWVLEELECTAPNLGDVYQKVFDKMTGSLEQAGLLTTLGNSPSDDVIRACCSSFANYIKRMLGY